MVSFKYNYNIMHAHSKLITYPQTVNDLIFQILMIVFRNTVQRMCPLVMQQQLHTAHTPAHVTKPTENLTTPRRSVTA